MTLSHTNELALIDIDGVLANDKARVDFALEKDWTSYFDPERMMADLVLPQGRELIEDVQARGAEIRYLTGRREDTREVTELWLERNSFPAAPVIMRPITVKIPLANLKADIISKLVLTGNYTHVVLFDDDPEVIRVVHEQVGPQHAVHCTWSIKKTAMVRAATA